MKWFRTARITRRSVINRATAFCALLLIASCRPVSHTQEDPAAVLKKIQREIEQADYDDARQASQQAWSHAANPEWSWRFKLQYALTLLLTERWDEADALLKPDLPPQLSRFSPRLQYLRGWNLFHRHNPSAAEVVRSAVAAAAEKNDPETEADGLLLLVAAGENNRKLAEQALSVSRRHQLRFQEAVSLNEVGMVAIHEQRYADAIADFSSLATLSKNLQAHFLEVSALTNIGECYFSVGDMERARQALLKALPMLRASENSELRVGVNRELGGLYSLRQQNAEAISNFRDALEAAKSAGPFSRIYISSANDLAEALLQTHTLDEAEKYNNLAFAAMRDANSRTWDLVAPNELNRADLFAERGQLNEAQVSYRKVLGLLSKEPPNSIQWSAYARLAVVQERAGRQAEAKKNFENALHAIELNRSQQAGAQYQITFLSALIRFYQQYVDFLVRQNHPWDALPVADSSRASVLSSGLISSREQPDFEKRVHKLARESNSTLLFYWLAPQASYVWAVTPDDDVFQKLPASSEEIERDVKSYSAYIQRDRQDTLEAGNVVGARLYNKLIAPLGNRLRPSARVVIVPDGALHGLNFETLLVPDARPHYWLEDVSVTVAPSLGILLTQNQSKTVSRKTLVFGDPLYAGTDYPPLPESGREVSRVSARFPSSTVITQGQAAADEYVKAQPGLFSVIHFSAHVDADPQSPLDSAIILSPSSGETSSSRLYARDVMNTPLSADLVTISGCSSAGAKALSGEGMVGFAWASFKAGARNTVTSLWAVDDRSTADLMDRFYAGVTAGKSYSAALREAKQQMLKSQFKKPYYWAPFQLYSRNLDFK